MAQQPGTLIWKVRWLQWSSDLGSEGSDLVRREPGENYPDLTSFHLLVFLAKATIACPKPKAESTGIFCNPEKLASQSERKQDENRWRMDLENWLKTAQICIFYRFRSINTLLQNIVIITIKLKETNSIGHNPKTILSPPTWIQTCSVEVVVSYSLDKNKGRYYSSTQ